jgi:hypothetical protein
MSEKKALIELSSKKRGPATYKIKISGDDHTYQATGETPGRAKYNFYLRLSDCCDITFGEFLKKIIFCRILHQFRPSDLFGDKKQFDRMKEMRGIDFAYQGMRIEVAGKMGTIVGSNSSLNLDVVFDGKYWADNCHPWWKTKYFDRNGNIAKDFTEKINAAQ